MRVWVWRGDKPPFDSSPAVFTPTLPGTQGLQTAPCYTGDRFLDNPAHQPPGPCVVEMEAYALAKVCAHFSVPFTAYKFITDGADGAAGDDWPSALAACGQALNKLASVL